MFSDPIFLALVLAYAICMILIAVLGSLVGIIHQLRKQAKKQ